MIAFDLTADLSNAEHTEPIQQRSLHTEVHFAVALEELLENDRHILKFVIKTYRLKVPLFISDL